MTRGAKAERRLVEQQNLRIGHQRAADRQHLLLAAGQRAGDLAEPLRSRGNRLNTRSRRRSNSAASPSR